MLQGCNRQTLVAPPYARHLDIRCDDLVPVLIYGWFESSIDKICKYSSSLHSSYQLIGYRFYTYEPQKLVDSSTLRYLKRIEKHLHLF